MATDLHGARLVLRDAAKLMDRHKRATSGLSQPHSYSQPPPARPLLFTSSSPSLHPIVLLFVVNDPHSIILNSMLCCCSIRRSRGRRGGRDPRARWGHQRDGGVRDGESESHRHGLLSLQRRPAAARRLRLFERIPLGALRAGRAGAPNLGGHQRDHAPHRRKGGAQQIESEKQEMGKLDGTGALSHPP